ncbi:hypothetical protein G6L00_16505 [Agrobacterium rhizogenes]|jgi:hypothetical protein|nr:hypothetical protein [Rhizobium rhizogenes]
MADKRGKATEETVDQAAEDHRDRIDLNDPHMSGQEAVERALGYRTDEPKAEEPKAE